MNIVDLFLEIIGGVAVVVGAVWGIFSFIKSSEVTIKKEVDSELEKVYLDRESCQESQQSEFIKVTNRLNELDIWRKEMNGNLKLIGEKQGNTNMILSEQKMQLTSITEAMHEVSKQIALFGQTIDIIKNGK